MLFKDKKLGNFFNKEVFLIFNIYISLAVPFLLILGRGYADGAMCFVSLCFICKSLNNKDWSWVKTQWFLLSLITCIFMLISGFLAVYDQNAGIEKAISWLRFPIFSMAFSYWIMSKEKAQRYLLPMLSILLILSSLDTIVQFVTGISLTGHPKPGMPGRLTGPFPYRLLIGTFLTRLIWPTVGLALMWAYSKNNDTKRLLFPIFLILLVGLTILISGERMAFALFCLSALIFLYFSKNLKKILIPIVAMTAIISVSLIFFIPVLQERIINNTAHVILHIKDSSYGAVWHNGFIAWKSSPIYGIGMSNFVPMCEKLGFSGGFKNELPQWTEVHCVRHPHNPYLEWLSALGVIGLTLFLSLILSWIIFIYKKFPSFETNISGYYASLGFSIGLIPFLWPFVASLSFFSNWSATLFWWVLGLALSNGFQVKKANYQPLLN